MISLSQILDTARQKFPSSRLRYVHPILYLVCEDSSFSNFDEEERRDEFYKKLNLNARDAEITLAATGVTLCLVTPIQGKLELSFIDKSLPSHHWIEFLAHAQAPAHHKNNLFNKIIHYYGFKGGQARSTILAMTAQQLANDGHRVLVIDADVEAPSLPAVFDAHFSSLSATLLGCSQFGLTPTPQTVFVPKSSGGIIDMIACRPSLINFDLDFAAFTLRLGLDPMIIERVFNRILNEAHSYDMILIDHRSGLSTTVLPIAASFPGPVVVCLRMDEQSERANAFFDVLFQQNNNSPGLFVSFSLDPEDNLEKMLGRHRSKIEGLLKTLSGAIARGVVSVGQQSEDMNPEPDDLLDYWIPWFHDRNFLSQKLPEVGEILSENQKSISKIRELLGISGKKITLPDPSVVSKKASSDDILTSSGNTDQGLLIETETLRKLRLPSTPYTYILGRKGTGKTRLLRALTESGQGEPIMVADDFPLQNAIRSGDPVLKDLAARIGVADSEIFWWILLDSKLNQSTNSSQSKNLQSWLATIEKRGAGAVSINGIAQSIVNRDRNKDHSIFLIDGVETAFSSTQIRGFVEGLFRFLSAIQSNPQINQRLVIRLFIRTDLARRAFENIEQQIEGRSLELTWDTQAIMNFVLSRISGLSWFRKNFAESTSQIDNLRMQLSTGSVPESECNDILMSMFPDQLRRNNLRTLTFLKTYFSDGIGETSSFYPRIYDTFLQCIADPSRISQNRAIINQLELGKVAQPLIISAHDFASRDYLQQVSSELKNLLRLSEDIDENKEHVDSLIEGFRGLPTPFEVDACIQKLSQKIEGVDAIRIREALRQMKQVGIFEDRPDYAGYWRVGRLFKSSLGMRYVR